jgi:hypothetical protein
MTQHCAPQPSCAPPPCAPHPEPCDHQAYCQSQPCDHSCGPGDCGHPGLVLNVDLDVHVALDFGHDCHV